MRDDDRVSFLDRRLGPGLELRVVTIVEGGSHAYDDSEWRDALVVMERGQIEIECTHGLRWSFQAGDVLWLAGLPLRALHNPGGEPAILSAVFRNP